MDLFEILFVLLFVLFPIMEQVLKRRRGPGDDAESGPPGPGGDAGSRRPTRPPERAEEMVPDDLWAILTGERRPPRDVATDDAPEEAPWSSEPEPAEAVPAGEPWRAEPVEEPAAAEPEPALPGTREYRGPEAYSLETLDHPAVSLERPVPAPQARPVPTPQARHRAFHARYDRPAPRRARTRSAISRALGDAGSVRQAFVLTEVLGPPKGLQ